MSILRSAASRVLPQEISIICSAHCSSRQAFRSFSSTSRQSSSSASASTDSGLITPHKLSFPDLPKFKARGSDVQVLTRPDQFYNFLLDGIRNAKKRIFLASLYIGKEETELVSLLCQSSIWEGAKSQMYCTDTAEYTGPDPSSSSESQPIPRVTYHHGLSPVNKRASDIDLFGLAYRFTPSFLPLSSPFVPLSHTSPTWLLEAYHSKTLQ